MRLEQVGIMTATLHTIAPTAVAMLLGHKAAPAHGIEIRATNLDAMTIIAHGVIVVALGLVAPIAHLLVAEAILDHRVALIAEALLAAQALLVVLGDNLFTKLNNYD